MNKWESVEGKQTYRIVLTDLCETCLIEDTLQYANLIYDWLLWRNYQYLDRQNLTVIKIGHGDFCNNVLYLNILEKLLAMDLSFVPGSLRFALYNYVDGDVDNVFYKRYLNIIKENKNENYYFCISLVVDVRLLENDKHYFDKIVVKLNNNKVKKINNIVLFKNIEFVNEKTVDLLTTISNEDLVVGYDIVSKKSNFSIQEDLQSEDVSIFFNYLKNKITFLNKIMPEYFDVNNVDVKNNDMSLIDVINNQVDSFINDGMLVNIKDKTVSPLIYGSADDFSLFSAKNHNDMILLTKDEMYTIYQKEALKLFTKNHCSMCDFARLCSSQRIWWLNMFYGNKSKCKIGLPTYLFKE